MKKTRQSKKGNSRKAGIGRPTKLTSSTLRIICDAVAQGVPNKYAAALAGISEDSFYKYQRENTEFSESIQKATASGIAARLALICQAAKSDHRAAAWWLEHTQPEHFSKSRIEVHHDGTVEGRLTIPTALLDELARSRSEHEKQRNDGGR